MSAQRLTAVYSAFFRQMPCRIKPSRNSIISDTAAHFSIGKRKCVEARPNQRYGTANEPPPHLSTTQPTPPAVVDLTGQIGKSTAVTKPNVPSAEAKDKAKRDMAPIGSSMQTKSEAKPAQGEKGPPDELAAADRPVQGPYVPPSNPMETVLQMPAPGEQEDSNKKKPPHLQTPPYVHHFDTWTLVQDLEKGGFPHTSAVDTMKAMRLMLAENLNVARDALVSKSNVENETYLFKAACSELKTEVMNNRRAEMEKMRAQRTQLQHEVEILNQRMDQMLKGMKEEMKGLFDDRKMNTKMEQRTMESRIQEINYKITVALNSDARSDVEAIRWILTRRAVMALVIVAVAVLGALRYNSYMMQTQEEERKRMKPSSTDAGRDGNPSDTRSTMDASTQISAADLGLAGAASLADAQAVKESEGRGYVSLG